LALWACGLSAVAATLLASHWSALPTVAVSARQKTAMALSHLRSAADQNRWMAVHVLYAECRCSQRIFDHLFASARPRDTAEKILLVGQAPDQVARARRGGFDVHPVTAEALANRFFVQSAPMLIVLDDTDTLRYAGGYTERKQGPDIRDTALIEGLISRAQVNELPMFGCAVSEALQQVLDPLGVKYTR
jgi:thioredoxin-related protein